MVWIPSGAFSMGSADFYPEERPVRHVRVSGFWIDRDPVTVDEFLRFVEATGYVTLAERPVVGAGFLEHGLSFGQACAVKHLAKKLVRLGVPCRHRSFCRQESSYRRLPS